MIQKQKDQIIQMAQSLKNQATNLERLPGSIQSAVMGSGNKLTGLLTAIGQVNNATSQATQQFDAVYARLAQSGTSADMIAARLSMLKARNSAIRTGVESSSIAQSVTDQFDKMRVLLSNAFTAKGNLDIQQIATQQQALLANIQLQQQVMEAAAARSLYEEKAEAVVLARMRLEMVQQATTYIDTAKPYAVGGKLPDYEAFYPRR
jgi:conjugal transfer/entry exclusion protein